MSITAWMRRSLVVESGARALDSLSASGTMSAVHPFPSKLTLDQAEEVRHLRRDGAPLAELAKMFGVAKSSISAVVHFHAHLPGGVFRVALPEFEAALLAEVADDEELPVEQLAADLLVEMLRSRAW